MTLSPDDVRIKRDILRVFAISPSDGPASDEFGVIRTRICVLAAPYARIMLGLSMASVVDELGLSQQRTNELPDAVEYLVSLLGATKRAPQFAIATSSDAAEPGDPLIVAVLNPAEGIVTLEWLRWLRSAFAQADVTTVEMVDRTLAVWQAKVERTAGGGR